MHRGAPGIAGGWPGALPYHIAEGPLYYRGLHGNFLPAAGHRYHGYEPYNDPYAGGAAGGGYSYRHDSPVSKGYGVVDPYRAGSHGRRRQAGRWWANPD